jgi:two-component system, LytTR family, response regulator LytT
VSERRLRVLVVDDEEPQLEDLARLVRHNPRVSEVQTAGTANDALVKLAEGGYDAVFLDVRMPDLDGLEIAKVLTGFPGSPALVFVSAFDASAVAAFELGAVDYLMKPVVSGRIDEALTRVEAGVRPRADSVERPPEHHPGRGPDVVAVRDLHGRGLRLLARPSILYIRAYGDYVRVCADSGRYLLRSSLSAVERRFADHGFVRIHRQYVANLRRATEFRVRADGSAAIRFDNGDEIPVSRRHVPELRRHVHC